MSNKKKRMANIELLRILAMMMVVSLHFLAKGEVLPALTNHMDASGYVAWILETISICAVNTYVLISGYFLVETGFRTSRVLSLICQVLFYTILVPVVLIALGILDVPSLTMYQLLEYVFPVQMLHYWFVSAYVLLFLFTPVLNAAVRAMKKKQLGATIIILLIMEAGLKSVIPVRLELDNLGYDALWFMCVYLIAAYMRLYGIPYFDSAKKSAFCYFAGLLGIFVLTMIVRFVYLKTGLFENFISAGYGYNHLLNIFSAVALFYTFYYLNIPDGIFAKWITKISPYTFGVYLLHEQVEIRYLWPKWLGADSCTSSLSLLLYFVFAVLVVFAAGSLVDALRNVLFKLIGRKLSGTRIDKRCHQIDDVVNGRNE